MKSILLLVIGVLRTEFSACHLFLLIVIADCKLLINPRVDPFFSLLSLLKTTMKIFFSFAFYRILTFKVLACFCFKMSISLAQVYCGIAILNE